MVTPVALVGWLACVFLAAAEPEVSVIYKKVGDEVVLRPSSKPDVIKTILWRDGSDIAAEWDGEHTEIFRQFTGRSSLDNSSGELTIRNLAREDSKLYTPEINNNVGRSVDLRVISPVPKPDISVSCDEGKTNCTLSCNGDTTGAEPASYKWKFNGGSSKEQHLTRENSADIKEFVCELENPISRESSEPISSPFTVRGQTPEYENNLKISSGLTVFICLLTAVLLVVIVHRVKAGKWFFQKESMPWEADFWKKTERQQPDAVDSNGTAHEEREPADEETPMKA